MKNIITVLLISAVILSGCTVKISPEVSLPYVSIKEGLPDVGKGAMVFFEEVTDDRPGKEIGRGPDGPIAALGSVPGTVRTAIEELFRKSGFSVSDSAPMVVQVSLKQWSAVYRRGGIDAQASVGIKVYDPGNKLAYSGSYSGSSSVEGSPLDDLAVKETLGTSMSEAIHQMVRDRQLIRLLASF
jgi:uncharacterized lipoprotein YajG